jgi:UDP-3-O-[3-hydroxymyristoyl] N-acetylglucosamine deacetylase
LAQALLALKGMNHSFPLLKGVGIHTGRVFELTATRRQPSRHERSGPHFLCEHKIGLKRVYLEAPAHLGRLSGTSRSTAIIVRGAGKLKGELKTIEHLLAGAHVMGFPNVNFIVRDTEPSPVDTDLSFEIPILGGSSHGFENFFDFTLALPVREFYRVVRSFDFEFEGKSIQLRPLKENDRSPSDLVSLYSVEVDFGPKLIQKYSWEMDWRDPTSGQDAFWGRVAKARTFGFKHELESLKSRGLGLGGTLANAILLDGNEVLNPEGFLFENELAAHKLLDALGDFALLGAPLIGSVHCKKAGHAMHLRALSEALKQGVLEKELRHQDSSKIYLTK